MTDRTGAIAGSPQYNAVERQLYKLDKELREFTQKPDGDFSPEINFILHKIAALQVETMIIGGRIE